MPKVTLQIENPDQPFIWPGDKTDAELELWLKSCLSDLRRLMDARRDKISAIENLNEISVRLPAAYVDVRQRLFPQTQVPTLHPQYQETQKDGTDPVWQGLPELLPEVFQAEDHLQLQTADREET